MEQKLCLRFVRAILVAKVAHNLQQQALFNSDFGFTRPSTYANAAWKTFAKVQV